MQSVVPNVNTYSFGTEYLRSWDGPHGQGLWNDAAVDDLMRSGDYQALRMARALKLVAQDFLKVRLAEREAQAKLRAQSLWREPPASPAALGVLAALWTAGVLRFVGAFDDQAAATGYVRPLCVIAVAGLLAFLRARHVEQWKAEARKRFVDEEVAAELRQWLPTSMLEAPHHDSVDLTLH